MEKEPWECICFDGIETLVLAKFTEHIKNYPECSDRCIVYVEGRWVKTDKDANVLGIPKKGNIDGYIRNIQVWDVYEEGKGKEKSVACINATLEDIAANRVSFLFFGVPNKWDECVRWTEFPLYEIRSIRKHTNAKMISLDRDRQYPHAIAVAKHLGDEGAAKILKSYLGRDFGPDMMERVTEAFKSLENLCKCNAGQSDDATKALINYIENHVSAPEYRNSVIYAIEALGFVANNQEDSKAIVCEFLSKLLSSHKRDEFKDKPSMYWHIVWSSLVALTRTMSHNLNTSPIFVINKSLLDGNVLAEIEPAEARSVIQKVMAEVIISRGGITRNEYLSIFGLSEDDLKSMEIAGREDNVAETKRFGESLLNWVSGAAPNLCTKAANLTEQMAIAILTGLAKAHLGLP